MRQGDVTPKGVGDGLSINVYKVVTAGDWFFHKVPIYTWEKEF
jgi:hypothetical protein